MLVLNQLEIILCMQVLIWPGHARLNVHMVMSLFKYFICLKSKDNDLPNPSGPLSEVVPSTSIEEANKEVDAQLSKSSAKRHEGYMILTPEQKARVGKYAAENGTTKAICHFAKDIPNLKESTVRGWKMA